MSSLNYIIESIPVCLAIYSAVLCAHRYATDRRRTYRQVLLLGVICSFLLIIAQTSWIISSLVDSSLSGTWFANHVWSFFNSLTMLAFIILAANGGKPGGNKFIPSRK